MKLDSSTFKTEMTAMLSLLSALQGLLRKLGGSGNSALEEMLHGSAANDQRMKVWGILLIPSLGAGLSRATTSIFIMLIAQL